MQCPQCGREIDDRYAHCPFCSAEIWHGRRRTFRSHVALVTSLSIALILVLFAVVFAFTRINSRETAALGAVQQHMYRGLPMDDIFRSLDGCRWRISGDRIVSVSGTLSQDGSTLPMSKWISELMGQMTYMCALSLSMERCSQSLL